MIELTMVPRVPGMNPGIVAHLHTPVTPEIRRWTITERNVAIPARADAVCMSHPDHGIYTVMAIWPYPGEKGACTLSLVGRSHFKTEGTREANIIYTVRCLREAMFSQLGYDRAVFPVVAGNKRGEAFMAYVAPGLAPEKDPDGNLFYRFTKEASFEYGKI